MSLEFFQENFFVSFFCFLSRKNLQKKNPFLSSVQRKKYLSLDFQKPIIKNANEEGAKIILMSHGIRNKFLEKSESNLYFD